MASPHVVARRGITLLVASSLSGMCDAWSGSTAAEVDCPTDAECRRSTNLDESSMLQTRRFVDPLQVQASDAVCDQDLGKSCAVIPCAQNNGPVECVDTGGRRKECKCASGFCLNEDRKCVSKAKFENATILACDSDHCTFPSQQKRQVGLASSGGGGRALSFLVGVLRGLRELGWDESRVFMNVVSGSSWASAPYIFSNRTETQLLGESTTPEQLSIDFLGKVGSEIGACQNLSTDAAAIAALAARTPVSELWTSAIASTFLEPFGIDNSGTYMAASKEDVERIKSANPALIASNFQVPTAGRPAINFQITLLSPSGFKGGSQSAVSLQVAPDFTGSPFYPNDGTVTYYPSDKRRKDSDEAETRIVGGGFAETFSFGGAQPVNKHEQGGAVDAVVGAPSAPFTLGDAIGASSWAVGGQMSQTISGSKFNPLVQYWPVSSESTLGINASTLYQLSDGGSLDNSGILVLLQREIPTILWVANNYRGLNMSYPWDRLCECGLECFDEFDPVAAQLTEQFMDKFGYGVEASANGYYYQNNQVFEQTKIMPFACDIWAMVSSGRPAVVTHELEVLENTWWGIKGSVMANITVVYLENSTMFNSKLPQETQEEIALGEAGMFANFPIYKTMYQLPKETTSYTMEQINLLSAYGQWVISEKSDELRTLLGIGHV